jgi:2-polyprenyl-3-methyl-5-hydroxy-6-metoxy-1,4-benzoquinol methylase
MICVQHTHTLSMQQFISKLASLRDAEQHRMVQEFSSSKEIYDREASFADEWASEVTPANVDVRAAFESITAPENRFILKMMGSVEGKRVLDLGAGVGESCVYFALQGADVTAVDISHRTIEFQHRLAAKYGVQISGVTDAAESFRDSLGLFDIVYMGNLIHHVTDRDKLFKRVRDALKPGGKFFSWDPLVYNPLINVYRRIATRVRTDYEIPLSFADINIARRYFEDVQHREFWILSLALFLKYYFLDHVNPNQDRYWKRILREPEDRLWWFKPLQSIDSILTKVPELQKLSWNIVMWGSKSR